MAELGSINFTDVNRGTRTVDRRDEVRGLGSALDLSKKVVEEGIKAKVTGDMLSAIDETQEEAVESPSVSLGPEQTAVGNPREDELRSNLDRWKLQAQQGNSSQRTMATIRIKEVLNEAQASFPWMTEELQQRAGLVIAGNADLAELGLSDAANVSQAKAAQGQINDIQSYATKEWKEDGSGGLGMSPSLVVGSDPWMAQFMELDDLKTRQQANARAIAMSISNAEATAIELEDSVSLMLQGKNSTARAGYHALLSANGFDAALGAAQKGEDGSLEVLRQFKTTGVPIIIDGLEVMKQEFVNIIDTHYTGRLRGTKSGQRVSAQAADYIAQIDSIISKFRVSADELPTAMEQIDSLVKIRGANVMRGLSEPNKNFVAVLSGPGKFLIEASALAKTADGLVLQNQLGVQATGVLLSSFPDIIGPNATASNRQVTSFLTSGQGSITPDLSASGINTRLDKIRSDTTSPWYVNTTTDKGDLEGAFWSVDNHTRLWNAALTQPAKYATPQMAAQYLTGVNDALRAFNQIGEKPEDVSQIIRASLADDRLLQAIDTVGDNADVVAQRRAFGMSAKEWYRSTKPGDRQDKVARSYNSVRIDGVPLRELAKVDISAMTNDGAFTYEIDTDNFNIAVTSRFATMQDLDTNDQADFGVRPRRRQQAEEEVRNEILEAMEPIAREVNESITITRNLDAATSVNAESRKRNNVRMQFFDELGWLGAFNYKSTE